MIVREYQDGDLERLKELHRNSGLGYDLPQSLSSEEFFARYVVEDGKSVVMAALLRATCEPYLLVDGHWRNPAWRFEALQRVEGVCRQAAQDRGIREAHAFLPPSMEKRFGRRLIRMGWTRYAGEEWRCYSTEV